MSAPCAIDTRTRCDRCARTVGRAYRFHESAGASRLRCLGCALTHRPLVLRSLSIALVVGAVLVAINQGDALVRGEWNRTLVWKAALTYSRPFVVPPWVVRLKTRLK